MIDIAKLRKSLVIKDVALLTGSDTEELFSTIVGRVSTGWSLLDAALGGGGVPLGRLIEIYGKESSGKSTLSYQIMGNAQAAGGVAILIDPEMTFAPAIATAAGMDISSVIIPTSETLTLDGKDNAFELICELLKKIRTELPSPAPIVVVWDTLAATPTCGELDGDANKSGGLYRARVIREGLRRLSYVAATTHSSLIILNHVHEVVDRNGGWGGPKFATPGGMAPKFHASARIHLKSGASLTVMEGGEKTTIGHVVYATLDKSKLSPPRGQVSSRLYYNHAISDPWSIFDYLKDKGVITTSGPWHRCPFSEAPDGELKFYEKDFMNKLNENPGLLEELKATAVEKYSTGRAF